MKCCGKDRDSKYCPNCGSKLFGGVAFEIAHFIRNTRVGAVNRLSEAVEGIRQIESGAEETWKNKNARKNKVAAEKRIAQYDRWIEWLTRADATEAGK